MDIMISKLLSHKDSYDSCDINFVLFYIMFINNVMALIAIMDIIIAEISVKVVMAVIAIIQGIWKYMTGVFVVVHHEMGIYFKCVIYFCGISR